MVKKMIKKSILLIILVGVIALIVGYLIGVVTLEKEIVTDLSGCTSINDSSKDESTKELLDLNISKTQIHSPTVDNLFFISGTVKSINVNTIIITMNGVDSKQDMSRDYEVTIGDTTIIKKSESIDPAVLNNIIELAQGYGVTIIDKQVDASLSDIKIKDNVNITINNSSGVADNKFEAKTILILP
jgi:hypothetical protein